MPAASVTTSLEIKPVLYTRFTAVLYWAWLRRFLLPIPTVTPTPPPPHCLRPTPHSHRPTPHSPRPTPPFPPDPHPIPPSLPPVTYVTIRWLYLMDTVSRWLYLVDTVSRWLYLVDTVSRWLYLMDTVSRWLYLMDTVSRWLYLMDTVSRWLYLMDTVSSLYVVTCYTANKWDQMKHLVWWQQRWRGEISAKEDNPCKLRRTVQEGNWLDRIWLSARLQTLAVILQLFLPITRRATARTLCQLVCGDSDLFPAVSCLSKHGA